MRKEASSERTRKIIEFDRNFRKNGVNILCGIDEAGRGPLAGPVVAAAVVFSDDSYIDGIYDSKKLTPKKRTHVYSQIIKEAICWSVGIIEHDEIDSVNILKATAEAMNSALKKIKVKPDLILADGNFYSHTIYNVNNIIRGDQQSYSIAAASIIAKVTRDRLMEEYERKYPCFSFSRHKGYGTQLHISEILEHGFTKIHRRSFRIKALKELI